MTNEKIYGIQDRLEEKLAEAEDKVRIFGQQEKQVFYKSLISKLVESDMQARRDILSEQIANKGHKPKIQEFEYTGKTGYNVIAETPRNGDGRIVVSSHYDGSGVLDNAQGVAVTLGLLEKLSGEKDITFLFTDLEEQGQLGARAYLERFGKEGIAFNVNVDGAGIGDVFVDLSKVRKLNAKLPNGERAEIELYSDADVFKEYGISSFSYATLPENQIEYLRDRRMPKVWEDRLFDDRGLDILSERDIEKTIEGLAKAIYQLRGEK